MTMTGSDIPMSGKRFGTPLALVERCRDFGKCECPFGMGVDSAPDAEGRKASPGVETL